MEKSKKLAKPPKEMTIGEASAFWDENSLFEFNGTEEVDVTFKLKKKQYIGIDRKIFEKLKVRAARLKTSPESLLEKWISEKAS
jgi:hypothetical protein